MRRLIARARDERGFTMVTVMAVMFCVTLLSIAALSAAQGDLKPGGHDKSRKVAYAAAEAGLHNYLFHLSQDLDYWARCTTGPLPNAVNDPWNGIGVDPRRWMRLPGSGSRYTIELMPANGKAACSTADPEGTMIDAASGTFKIRSTGQDVATGVKRSLIATFKRKSLLDYLWFTDKEARAPALYGMDINSDRIREKSGGRDFIAWGHATCERYFGDDPALGNRAAQAAPGEYYDYSSSPAGYADFTMHCRDGGFSPGDVLAGPVHTNDEFEILCGPGDAPKLGDSIDDVVETSSLGRVATTPADPNAGWHSDCGTEPYVNFPGRPPLTSPPAGTWKAHAAPLTLPLSNTQLKRDAAPAYRFKGTTTIALHGTTMRVTGTRDDGTVLSGSDVAIPAGGVVYVANDGACPEYVAGNSAAAPSTCGTLKVEGDYAANVTLTAEADILITHDIKRTAASSPYLLGLIANNYVRVDHPVTGCSPAGACNYLGRCRDVNHTSPSDVLTIQAAILSLTASFIADNWFCGGELGELEVYGAIAQMYRGPVGRQNRDPLTLAEWSTGFTKKDYRYDDRLKFRSPPHYLDPVQAQWRVQTFSEQAPAR